MTTASPESPRRRRKRERTADKIYLTAVRLFTERGFDETTVQDITDAADVGKGTFFNYFATKEAVLVRFLEQRSLGSLEVAQRTAGMADPVARIGLIFDSLADDLLEDEPLSRLVLHASLRTRVLTAANRVTSTSFRTAFASVVRDGQASGHFDPAIPAEHVAEYLVALFFRLIIDYLELRQEFDLKLRLREAMSIISRGIATNP